MSSLFLLDSQLSVRFHSPKEPATEVERSLESSVLGPWVPTCSMHSPEHPEGGS